MPTNPAPGSNGSIIDLAGAPGADVSFDDLFPIDPDNVGAPQAQIGTIPPAVPQATPPQPEFFIKGQKSVYKTAEDAVRGLDTKDALIEQYRSFLQTQGVDPNTLQSTRTPAAQPQTPPPPTSYLEKRGRLYQELSAAVGKQDPLAYEQSIENFQEEYFNARIGPVIPLLAEVSRQKAIRQVAQEVPDFPTFITSEDYRTTLERVPVLKDAINNAENNFSQASQLPQLYQLAYLANQGSRRPEAVPVVQPTNAPPPIANRPTSTPSSLTPPQPGVAPDLRTTEGRKTLIRDAEARGIQDYRF